jgi:hypothetical protein
MLKPICAAVLAASLGALAAAETWDFELSTNGADTFWTSPTNVDPTAAGYDSSYVLTEVTATVLVFGAPVDVDALDQLPPEFLSGMTVVAGPAPVVLFDDSIASPPPPEPASIAADVRIELDAAGFAQASATNITLGNVTVNVPPFGDLTVPLSGLSFAGTITFNERARGPEDLNNDGVVDAADLAIVLAAWGPCPALPAPCPADFNGDGFVDAADLAQLLAAWG